MSDWGIPHSETTAKESRVASGVAFLSLPECPQISVTSGKSILSANFYWPSGISYELMYLSPPVSNPLKYRLLAVTIQLLCVYSDIVR